MIWRNLFDPCSPETRGMRFQTRALELVVMACVLASLWEWVPAIGRNPAVVAPLGLARYVDISALLDTRAAALVAATGSALLLLGFFGIWRGAYLAALALFHLQYVARFCLGKTGHGAHLAGLALLAFGIAAISFRDDSHRRKAALGLTVLLFGVGYTWAGVSKLIASGPGWIDGHHLWLWIEEQRIDAISSYGSARLNGLQHAILDNYRLGTLLLSLGLAAELCSWLAWWKPARPWVFTALLAMHVGIHASLGVLFLYNELLLLPLILPLARWVDQPRSFAPLAASANVPVPDHRNQAR
jgi:hypothetical protein